MYEQTLTRSMRAGSLSWRYSSSILCQPRNVHVHVVRNTSLSLTHSHSSFSHTHTHSLHLLLIPPPHLWWESVWEKCLFDIISLLSKIQSCLYILEIYKKSVYKGRRDQKTTDYLVLCIAISMVKPKDLDDVSMLSERGHMQGSGADLHVHVTG